MNKDLRTKARFWVQSKPPLSRSVQAELDLIVFTTGKLHIPAFDKEHQTAQLRTWRGEEFVNDSGTKSKILSLFTEQGSCLFIQEPFLEEAEFFLKQHLSAIRSVDWNSPKF